MDTAGIGVDIVEVSRMERILDRTPSFEGRVFTDEERAYCNSMARPAVHFAARFAAREAVLKALGCGFGQGVGFKDVAVSRDSYGRPSVVLSGKAAELASEAGILEIALSLSHTSELAVANAMAITADVRPRPKRQGDDEKTQIARSFREARSVLDELERVQSQELEYAHPGLEDETPFSSSDVRSIDETDSQL